jgi:hypothetical protein
MKCPEIEEFMFIIICWNKQNVYATPVPWMAEMSWYRCNRDMKYSVLFDVMFAPVIQIKENCIILHKYYVAYVNKSLLEEQASQLTASSRWEENSGKRCLHNWVGILSLAILKLEY